MPCSHRDTITTITAGIAREVCEVCGHISIRFVEPAVRADSQWRTRPVDSVINLLAHRKLSDDAKVRDSLRFLRCRLCSQAAVYLIPSGVVCDEHAWQAAARIRWEDSDPWVPIKIHATDG
ncbi:MAG: hypothetical protein WCE80_00610 [Acidimicrobiia bacterium]